MEVFKNWRERDKRGEFKNWRERKTGASLKREKEESLRAGERERDRQVLRVLWGQPVVLFMNLSKICLQNYCINILILYKVYHKENHSSNRA